MNKTFIYGYLLEKPNSGDAETAVISQQMLVMEELNLNSQHLCGNKSRNNNLYVVIIPPNVVVLAKNMLGLFQQML